MSDFDVKDARDRLKAETRAALLAAAGRILADEGLAALTVRRVAGEVGASAKLVYTLYGGKDGLLEALYLDAFAGLAGALDRSTSSLKPRARLVAMVEAYRRYALAHPDRYGVMFGEAGAGFRPSLDARRYAWSTFSALKQALADHLGRAAAPDTIEVRTRVLWAAMHGTVSLELRGLLGAPDMAQAVYDRAVDDLLAG